MNLTECISHELFYLLAIVIYSSRGEPNATQNADSLTADVSSDVHRSTPVLQLDANLEHTMRTPIADEHAVTVHSSCLNGGNWIASLDRCECPITYGGRFCEVHLCLNGGFLAADGHSCHCGKFEGKHCEQPACVGGMLNVHGKCDCIGNYFGRFCELFCVHGRLVDGHCICYDGFEGITCTRCNATYVNVNSGDCGEISRRRRPVMQSRFALSGLSLCLITIILLWISVVTRRRRTMLAASHFERMANERLLRDQQRRLCERRALAIQIPRTSRSRAVCEFRHFVQAARNADVRLLTEACGLHSPRFLRTADISARIHTPPPEYCATPQESPPSYEEATRSGRGDALK